MRRFDTPRCAFGEIVLKEGNPALFTTTVRGGKVVNVEARALIGWVGAGRCDPCSGCRTTERGKSRYGAQAGQNRDSLAAGGSARAVHSADHTSTLSQIAQR